LLTFLKRIQFVNLVERLLTHCAGSAMIDPHVIPATLAITLLTEAVSIVSKRMRIVSSVLARSAQSVRATCSFLEASVLHVI
jgi:hypothetical protein